MSDTAQQNQSETPGRGQAGQEPRRTDVTKRGGGSPASRGRTTIADGVVEKIAGLAARDVSGVHAMGSGLSRTFGAMRDRVPGGTKSVSRG